MLYGLAGFAALCLLFRGSLRYAHTFIADVAGEE